MTTGDLQNQIIFRAPTYASVRVGEPSVTYLDSASCFVKLRNLKQYEIGRFRQQSLKAEIEVTAPKTDVDYFGVALDWRFRDEDGNEWKIESITPSDDRRWSIMTAYRIENPTNG